MMMMMQTHAAPPRYLGTGIRGPSDNNDKVFTLELSIEVNLGPSQSNPLLGLQGSLVRSRIK